MDSDPTSLQALFDESKEQLNQLTELIRGELTGIQRKILVSLITTDIHGRDIIENLANENIDSTQDFIWQQ